jgi:hypothetical protein
MDKRFVYGATCTWFGSINEVAVRSIVPCCPVCGGVLFEMATEAEWWAGVERFQSEGHEGYRAMLEWQRTHKRCFDLRDEGLAKLVAAYKEATGIEVTV